MLIKMTNIYVVRHLKTSRNANWLCQGWKWWRILKKSKENICDIENLLCNININHIVSSDLTRARKTAKLIKNQIWFDKKIIYSKNFREMNFWIFEWISYRDIFIKQPEIYDNKWLFKYNVKLLSWESISDLIMRLRKWLITLNWLDWNILLIAHWNVIRWLYSILNNIDYNQVYLTKDIESIKIHKFYISKFLYDAKLKDSLSK